MSMLQTRRMVAGSEDDALALFRLFEQAAEYSLLVEGKLPTLPEARAELSELPPGKTLADKFFWGYWRDNTLVGCADLIRGYPTPDIAYIGLLLFAATHQGQGLGVQALAHLMRLARSWQCTSLRLAVIDNNTRALAFWQREGFREIYRKPTTQFTGDAIVMEKTL